MKVPLDFITALFQGWSDYIEENFAGTDVEVATNDLINGFNTVLNDVTAKYDLVYVHKSDMHLIFDDYISGEQYDQEELDEAVDYTMKLVEYGPYAQ